MNQFVKISISLVLVALFFYSLTSSAQTDDVSEKYERASILKPIEMYYPMGARRLGVGYWIKMTLQVNEDGTTENIEILDTVGNKKFSQKAAKLMAKAYAKSKHKPATKDGVPIKSYITREHNFNIISMTQGASKPFFNRYTKFNEALDQGDVEGANKILTKLIKRPLRNIYEANYLHMGKFQLSQKLKQPLSQQANHASRMLDDILDKRLMNRDVRGKTLLGHFIVLQKLRNYPHALGTAERLRRTDYSRYKQIENYASELEEFVVGNSLFTHEVTMPEHGI